MIASIDLLRVYLRTLIGASGAQAATLFVPSNPGGLQDAILVHEGVGTAVPELTSQTAAMDFHGRVGLGTGKGRKASAEGIQIISSTQSDDLLIYLPLSAETTQVIQARTERRRISSELTTISDQSWEVWIGLRGIESVRNEIPEKLKPLLLIAGALVAHARDVSEILGDPLTGLLIRSEFERRLGHLLARAECAAQSSMLLLVNPDDFGSINELYGPEKGDAVLRLVGSRLRDSLRASDIVARYGGAIFIALVEGVDEAQGALLGQKIIDALSEVLALDDSFGLTVSAGAVSFKSESNPLTTSDLIRRAEQALRVAKCAGGGCLRFWEPAHENSALGDLDQLSSVFTGNPSKDYRNMKLLSQTVTAIVGSVDFDELTSGVVKRIQSTLRADHVALIDWSAEGRLHVISAVGPAEETPVAMSEAVLEEAGEYSELLNKVREEGRPVTAVVGAGGLPRTAFAVPLVAGDACLGTLYVDGSQGWVALDSSDVDFLQTLASQLALALDRARLSQVEKEWRETERQHLQAEIDELRQVSQRAELVCESPQIKELLATARRVAQTDATVLICGESGTGKELISSTIHDLGPRRDRPFVVVDCASIPTTLIESELFGHERGAYTGAQERKNGRLREADGGTVILDEIGELPLEVQGKLLRFVQEKQLTPVGGSRVHKVDVRVVAATNRNLEDEVREGRFREDLFHRLNVIRLDIPPLRQRPQDITSLISLFLRQFSAQYQKGKQFRLSPTAVASVLEYAWPGNVRELRNRIMQAVILSGSEEIGPDQLGLTAGGSPPAVGEVAQEPSVAAVVGSAAGPAILDQEPGSSEELWEALEMALGRLVGAVVGGEKVELPPLNRWLTEDLVIDAYAAADEVLTRGADILGIPEATFRRKLHKAMESKNASLATRPAFWSSISPLLSDLVRAVHPAAEDLLKRARNILLVNVLRHSPSHRATGAALMGVTEPTFRRWVRDLECAAVPVADGELSVADALR